MRALVRPRLSVGTLLLSALLIAPLRAASPPSPRDELLRFVPADVGFCVVVQNLRDTGKALAESPFIEQFRNSKAGKALQDSKEIADLLNIERDLKKHFGIGWDDLRDDILGDAVVFAYRPGKKGDEQGLMLIRARNDKALSSLVERFNEKQKEDGDLKELKELKHKKIVYYARVEKRETTYYHLRGPILVFSGQEKMLQEALDLAEPADAEPALAKWFDLLGAKKALFAVLINPRAFDKELTVKADAGDTFLKMFLVYWKALDRAVLSLTLDRDATLALGVSGRSEKLPSAARKLFTELAKPSDLWRQIPEDALFAIGGRIDFAALMDVFGDFLPDADREKLHGGLNRFLKGKDVRQVLPFIGPDIALWLTVPVDAKHLFPEGLFAVGAAAGDKTAPVDQALLERLNFWAEFAATFAPKPLTLKTGTFDKQDVRYLESELLPLGVRPAFALKHGFLVLAGAPETIGRFAAPVASNSDGPAPLLRISFKAWRTYIKSRRDALADLHAKKEHLKPEDAGAQIDDVMRVLEFVDRLEIRHQSGNGHAVVSLVIQTAKPLKK